MKQNITLSLEKPLLKRTRIAAARRGMSISMLLADELRILVEREDAYEEAKAKALAGLADAPAL